MISKNWYLSCSVKFAITLQEVLQKELDAAKSARSSLEDSKRALEDELEEQKHTAALLQEQLQKEKRATNAEAEAKDTLKERLEAVQSSATLLQAKLEEAKALEDVLTEKLLRSQASEALFEELNGDMISKLHDADERMSALAKELKDSKDRTYMQHASSCLYFVSHRNRSVFETFSAITFGWLAKRVSPPVFFLFFLVRHIGFRPSGILSGVQSF